MKRCFVILATLIVACRSQLLKESEIERLLDNLNQAMDSLTTKKDVSDDSLQHVEGSGEAEAVDALMKAEQFLTAHRDPERTDQTTNSTTNSNAKLQNSESSTTLLSNILGTTAVSQNTITTVSTVASDATTESTHQTTKSNDQTTAKQSTVPSTTIGTTPTTITQEQTTKALEQSTKTWQQTTKSTVIPKPITKPMKTSAKICIEKTKCYHDLECGQGRCLGSHLGKCNCRACINSISCSTDGDCGGLKGACREGICRCAESLMFHISPLLIDSMTSFCDLQSCRVNSDECHGLPCNIGYCHC